MTINQAKLPSFHFDFELTRNYNHDGVPHDQQGDCIEAVFSDPKATEYYKQVFGDAFEDDGSDEDSNMIIEHILQQELTPYIREMVEDWRDNGF